MDNSAFLARIGEYKKGGWRLSIINATTILAPEGGEGDDSAFDISWSFARNGEFEHLRERVKPGEEVPSISEFFGAAFLYENEMRELFGIDVIGINVDLQGQMYKTSNKVPFAASAIRARLESFGKKA